MLPLLTYFPGSYSPHFSLACFLTVFLCLAFLHSTVTASTSLLLSWLLIFLFPLLCYLFYCFSFFLASLLSSSALLSSLILSHLLSDFLLSPFPLLSRLLILPCFPNFHSSPLLSLLLLSFISSNLPFPYSRTFHHLLSYFSFVFSPLTSIFPSPYPPPFPCSTSDCPS